MKKNVLTHGLIAGGLIATFMVFMVQQLYKDPNYKSSELLGYTSMILAFSLIFVGIKNFRDKNNEGVISFGQALKVGLLITVVASTVYVITWLIVYYGFIPDFMDKYSAHMIADSQAKGLSQMELDKQIADVNSMKEMYKNPLFVILITYAEILPVGLVISLLSAFILKRK